MALVTEDAGLPLVIPGTQPKDSLPLPRTIARSAEEALGHEVVAGCVTTSLHGQRAVGAGRAVHRASADRTDLIAVHTARLLQLTKAQSGFRRAGRTCDRGAFMEQERAQPAATGR